MSGSDCEIPTFSRWEEIVSRKQHNCCECHAPIVKGEKYFKAVGVWDGNFITSNQHLVCMEACMLIRDELNDGECVCFGGMMDWCWEYRHDSKENKANPGWKKLRSLLAVIKWRERKHKMGNCSGARVKLAGAK